MKNLILVPMLALCACTSVPKVEPRPVCQPSEAELEAEYAVAQSDPELYERYTTALRAQRMTPIIMRAVCKAAHEEGIKDEPSCKDGLWTGAQK